MISVYLFTAALFLTGLFRFANEEKTELFGSDEERILDYSIASGSISFYEEETEVFLSAPVFSWQVLPLDSGKITSAFGFRSDPFGTTSEVGFHNGTDIAVPMNSEVYAVSDGVVIAAEYDTVGGNYIRIAHENGFESYYGHLSYIEVSDGESVLSGQLIGLSGDSGKTTGPHLHFGLYYEKNPVDPDVYLNLEKYT